MHKVQIPILIARKLLMIRTITSDLRLHVRQRRGLLRRPVLRPLAVLDLPQPPEQDVRGRPRE